MHQLKGSTPTVPSQGTGGNAASLRLISVNLKDIMFPGKLKEIFAQVVQARKQGLAALEKARGETAALRNLANVAKMIEGNPNLLQLRLVQALGEAAGNTLILGMPSQSVPVPVSKGWSGKEIKGYIPEESKVLYQSKDGRQEKAFDSLEWLAAMCSHVPDKGEQMVRYYGY
jgi:regulator of protease activity HflC (stomatin/prohibitin superfamily)